jgi:hypothetical protein
VTGPRVSREAPRLDEMTQPYVIYFHNYKGIDNEPLASMGYKRWSRPPFTGMMDIPFVTLPSL